MFISLISNLSESFCNINKVHLSSALNIIESVRVESAVSFRKYISYGWHPQVVFEAVLAALLPQWVLCRSHGASIGHGAAGGLVEERSEDIECAGYISHTAMFKWGCHCPDLELIWNSLQYMHSFFISDMQNMFVLFSKLLLCYVGF